MSDTINTGSEVMVSGENCDGFFIHTHPGISGEDCRFSSEGDSAVIGESVGLS